jgi:preprotein translocase subunit SecG
MEKFLLVAEFVLTAFIVVAVMLQKSSSIGLGAYSGSNETVFGAKGPAAFLAKATMVLSLLFVANTVTLGYIYSKANQASVVDNVEAVPAPKISTTTKKAPEVPTAPSKQQTP